MKAPELSRSVLIMCMCFFISTLGNALWLSLLPAYLDKIGFSAYWIGAVMTAYGATLTISYIPSGKLTDRIGRKAPMLAGRFLSVVVVILMFLTKDQMAILILLSLYGVSVGVTWPAANAFIADSVPQERQGVAFGIYYVTTMMATIVGSSLSGVLATQIGFEKIFPLSALVVSVAALMISLLVHETVTRREGSIGVAVADSVMRSGTEAVRVLRRDRLLLMFVIALSIHRFAMYMFDSYVVLYSLKDIRLVIEQTGFMVSMWNAGQLLAQIPSGKMADKLGGERTFFLLIPLSTFAWFFYSLPNGFASAIAAVFLFGVATALEMPAVKKIQVQHSRDVGKGTVIGFIDGIVEAMATFAPLVGAAVWTVLGHSDVFRLAAVVNLVAMIPAIVLLLRRPQASNGPPAP
jgi:MFS family permease